jgi:hypothetical protein
VLIHVFYSKPDSSTTRYEHMESQGDTRGINTDFMDRLLVFHPLRVTREALFLPPRRLSTFNVQEPTCTLSPSVPTSLPEGESLHMKQNSRKTNANQCSEPTSPSSPLPPSQDTEPTFDPPPLPAHLLSANLNDRRRIPQRRRSVVLRPRRRLLRRKSKCSLMVESFASRAH